jgi:hypothetical protein
MCMDHKLKCRCGNRTASFNLRDDVMPVEIVNRLYCPECSRDITYNPDTMINDNGWVIEYNMEVARFMGQNLRAAEITPAFLFDEGYCTWRGIYPSDHIDSVREREEIVKLAKTDPKRYFREIKEWGLKRMERLAADGWRKANEREDARVSN